MSSEALRASALSPPRSHDKKKTSSQHARFTSLMSPFQFSFLNLLSFFLVRLSQQSVASCLADPGATIRRNKSQPAMTEAAVRACETSPRPIDRAGGGLLLPDQTLPPPPAPQAGRFLPHGESVPYAGLFFPLSLNLLKRANTVTDCSGS